MESNDVMGLVALGLIFGTGIVIAVSIFWFDHRTRRRALDVLRLYAERGEEPPSSVVQAVTAASGWGRLAAATQPPGTTLTPPRPPTRASHLAHAAANAVTVAGLGFLWWRASALGEAGATVALLAFLAALFFAASLAARLVYAYYAPNR